MAGMMVGCRGDAPPRASTLDAGGRATIIAEGGTFGVARIELQAGEAATIALNNSDSVPHSLVVYEGSSPDTRIAAATGEVVPGDEAEAVVLFSSSGERLFRCELHPETMQGVLTVR